MTKLTSLALGAGLALATIASAHAQSTVDGAWKLAVGVSDAPCTLTLTSDASGTAGTVAEGENCPGGLNTIATYKVTGNGIQLYAGTGDLLAWLKPKDGSFVGMRYADSRKLTLSR